MACSLGGVRAIEPRAPTINVKNVDGGPLAGADKDLEASTMNIKNIGGGLPGRCQSYRIGSTHHQRKKTSTVGPLTGADRYPGAPTMNVKNIDGGLPVRCRSYRTGSTHH
jgi:hypothetical protein